jgi:hypothetical protein
MRICRTGYIHAAYAIGVCSAAGVYPSPRENGGAGSWRRENVRGKPLNRRYIRRPIVTQILPAAEFFPAEDYHQRYYERMGIAPSCGIRRPID